MTGRPQPGTPTANADAGVAILVEDEDVIEHRSLRDRRGRQRGRVSLNLTAMIDVVFLLLVYFMVATEFKTGEEVYRLDLPQNLQSSQQRDPFELDEQPLRITVSSVGLGVNDYRIRLEGPYTQPRTFDELSEFLRPDSDTGKLFQPDHPIIIEPTSTTRWEHAMEAFNCAASQRYTNIIFAQAR